MLLSQYLREHKVLSLPGIGIFHLSGSLPSASESPEVLSSYISFENKKIREPEEDLISYIKQHTGKIKPLAMADLDSFIASGLQLLNIGKPFYIEGIGSIQQGKEGYEFSVGEITSQRLEQYGNRNSEEKRGSVFEESKYEPKTNPWQRIIVMALVLIGIAVVIFGGYYLYNKNNNANVNDGQKSLQDTQSTQQSPPVDSLAIKTDSASLVSNPSAYKFVVLNTPNKRRAMNRYNQLKELSSVKMETKDSTNFKLYFLIPATAADTLRIRDSLSRFYASKVVVEQ
ncbi:MAG TPA: hypothetical protein VJT83_07525 [Chitinophagaceae bacterium]|nr:hypothetical protein [Chitinophagaceae bacterium]